MMRDEPTTPTLADLMRKAQRRALLDVRTSLIAEVTAWHPDLQAIDAQPLVRHVEDVDEAEVVREYPLITRVPVSFLRWGGFVFRMPLAVGNKVLLVVTDREIERWLASTGGVVTPRAGRTHNLEDAVALPGIAPWASPIPGLADGDLVLGREDGSGEVRVRSDGTIAIGNTGATLAPVAREGDSTSSASAQDAQFWAWVSAVDTFIRSLANVGAGPATAVPPAVVPYVSAVSAAGGAPTAMAGVITSGSARVEVE